MGLGATATGAHSYAGYAGTANGFGSSATGYFGTAVGTLASASGSA